MSGNLIFVRATLLLALCALLFGIASFTFAQATTDDVLKRRAQLEEELVGLEARIEAQQVFLQEKQRETVSLERDVAIVDAKIESAELSIRARNLSIQKLGTAIGTKKNIIVSLTDKLGREKQSLAQLIRKTRELDAFSLAEVILANKNFSEFFSDVGSFNAIKSALQESFEEIASEFNVGSLAQNKGYLGWLEKDSLSIHLKN